MAHLTSIVAFRRAQFEFIAYTDDVAELFDRHGLIHYIFADDKQVYTSAPPVDTNGCQRAFISYRNRVDHAVCNLMLQDRAYLVQLSNFSVPSDTGRSPTLTGYKRNLKSHF